MKMPIIKCTNVPLPFGGNTHIAAADYSREIAEQNKMVYAGHKLHITEIKGTSCFAELEILLSAPVEKPVLASKSYNML